MKKRTEVAAEVVAAEITRMAEAEEEKRTGKIRREEGKDQKKKNLSTTI